nr:angiopoietin-related protein 2-like [Drosophila takahashii]
MVILRRQAPGTEDFNRNWKDYKNGFGDLRGEFFIGVEKLHQLTKDKTHELSVKLEDPNGITAFADYNEFEIDSEQESYALKSLGNYSGTAGDSLNPHKGKKFTTFDRDNSGDQNTLNCAEYFNGGWWYYNCFHCKLTGKYYKDGTSPTGYGIHWNGFRSDKISLILAEMMIRPKSL